MFHHILVPLDESSLAEQALPVAARIARASDGMLRLIHVVNDPIQYAWQYGDTALLQSIIEADYSRAETYLQQLLYREELHGIQVATEVLSGDPARTLLHASQVNTIDLLILSTHGYTGLKGWLLGSVANKLVHQSNVPLLLLHPETKETFLDRIAHQQSIRIMVPLDGSSLAEEAIAPAATLSRQLSPSGQAALHFASVLPINELTWPLVDKDLTLEQAGNYFTGVKQRLLLHGDTNQPTSITTSVTASPDVASSLVELAESGKGVEQVSGLARCDIIAIATHGRGAFTRWMMGSIAERIVHTTKLPVLLLRPQQMRLTADAEECVSETEESS